MKHHFFGTAINGDACLRLAYAMENQEEFQKKHNLCAYEYRMIERCVREYYKDGSLGTYMDGVAEIFQQYGFEVSKLPSGAYQIE